MDFIVVGDEVLKQESNYGYSHYGFVNKITQELDTESNLVKLKSLEFNQSEQEYVLNSDENGVVSFVQDNIDENGMFVSGIFNLTMPQSGHTIVTVNGYTVEYHKYNNVWQIYETDMPRTVYENGTSIEDSVDGFCCILDAIEDLKTRMTAVEGA